VKGNHALAGLVDLSGKGESLARSVNMSLVTVLIRQAIATVNGAMLLLRAARKAEYDTWADNQFEVLSIDPRTGDYGAMNWGDWWGERVNWGNHEYDTPLHILTRLPEQEIRNISTLVNRQPAI
jgi:hypothetical protein